MSNLPEIPFERLGQNGWDELLRRHRNRTLDLIESGRKLVHPVPIRALDGLSRRWAQKCDHHHFDLISKMAKDMPSGLWFMNFCYEWGCTTRVGLHPDTGLPVMLRSLDWPFDGIGRNIVMVEKDGKDGNSYMAATWPGYTGVITGMKSGRFAVAINQAPLSAPIQFHAANWSIARGRVWRNRHITPGHLLEKVFEEVSDFADAKRVLAETPIALPVIFSIIGTAPDERCIIERLETRHHLREGDGVAANHWECFTQPASARGNDSVGRAAVLADVSLSMKLQFSWTIPPVLNFDTRLAAEISPATADFRLRGYEASGPATADFDIRRHIEDTQSPAAQEI